MGENNDVLGVIVRYKGKEVYVAYSKLSRYPKVVRERARREVTRFLVTRLLKTIGENNEGGIS